MPDQPDLPVLSGQVNPLSCFPTLASKSNFKIWVRFGVFNALESRVLINENLFPFCFTFCNTFNHRIYMNWLLLCNTFFVEIPSIQQIDSIQKFELTLASDPLNSCTPNVVSMITVTERAVTLERTVTYDKGRAATRVYDAHAWHACTKTIADVCHACMKLTAPRKSFMQQAFGI